MAAVLRSCVGSVEAAAVNRVNVLPRSSGRMANGNLGRE